MKKVILVLTLLLMGTTAAYAGKQCINSDDGTLESRKNPRLGTASVLYGSICDTWRPGPVTGGGQKSHPKSGWQLCINGIDIKTGRHCWQSNNDWWNHGQRPRPVTLKGPQAFDVLHHGRILSNHMDWNGWSVYLVKYRGHRHSRLYNCRVSPNGNWAECTTTH